MKKTYKNGFTIIEIVFMIIVLSIVIPTLPLLILKGNEVIKNIKNTEYYATGYSSVLLVSQKLWDEKNSADLDINGKYYVLDSNSTLAQNLTLDCINHYRNGHYKSKNRRKCSTTDDKVSIIGLDGTESLTNFDLNDIDDFDKVQYRIIPKEKLTVKLKTEIDSYKPAGEESFEWLKKILAEPLDKNNLNNSINNISIKYSVPVNILKKWIEILPTTQVNIEIEFIDYQEPTQNTIITKARINPNNGGTTDIKRIKITITDLTDKNKNSRNKITYYYYATNIGTDIPLTKVNN